ncbi:MAG TPA: hydroxysqualene dehydroxylase HpnE [Dehalococcoidia bacterium]|nr:hydroxysqualene dehydroxylase HpnE [Dehalococcoidia bacterium]
MAGLISRDDRDLPTEQRDVLIVGGGLAGLAAGCELADRGFRVRLIERRGFLGGKVFSFRDKETGLQIDNGQHVFLGCCVEFLGFLDQIGSADRVYRQDGLRALIISPRRGTGVIGAVNLPPPLHLLPSFLRFRHLGPLDKLRAGRVLAEMAHLDPAGVRAADETDFATWLADRGQSRAAIDRFWNVIALPTLNDSADRSSAALALTVFREGLLRSRRGADLGYARVGLSDLIAEPAAAYLRARGATIETGARVASIDVDEAGAPQIGLADGRRLTAGRYVLALPPEALWPILSDRLRADPFFAPIGRFGTSPIVNVHVWFDRPIVDFDFAGFIDSPLQWVFNKSRILGLPPEAGQYLAISLSGAREYVDAQRDELMVRFLGELGRAFPRSGRANALRFTVIKEPDATFRPVPGIAALRPSNQTPIPNLWLAGAWTDTGWPATMEGAVRSGRTAARRIRDAAGFDSQRSIC